MLVEVDGRSLKGKGELDRVSRGEEGQMLVKVEGRSLKGKGELDRVSK